MQARASTKTKFAVDLVLWHLRGPQAPARAFKESGGFEDPDPPLTAATETADSAPVRIVIYTDFPSLVGPVCEVFYSPSSPNPPAHESPPSSPLCLGPSVPWHHLQDFDRKNSAGG